MKEQTKYLVLCVDDEKIILDSLKKELQAFLHPPYTLEVAQGGEDALEVIREFMEDGYEVPLVITDYIMPKMKGDQLLRSISEVSPQTFGILLTGQADLEGVRNSVRYGRLQSFLLKPWDTVDLKGDIQKTLNLYQQEKQIKLQNEHLQEMVATKTQELIVQNQQLTDLNHEKDNLMGIVAHDLRSPINNIVGCLELVRLSAGLNEDMPMYFGIINKEIDRAFDLIEDLLVISKYNALEKELTLEAIDVRVLVGKLFLMFAQKAEAKNINLHFEAPTDMQDFQTEKDMFERILENLLSNAIKFSPFDKNIWIKITHSSTEWLISVQDEGQGFSEADKQKVFQKFQKLSALPTAGETSTGLGLSITKIFTERLGGQIRLESTQGKGSTFVLTFPI